MGALKSPEHHWFKVLAMPSSANHSGDENRTLHQWRKSLEKFTDAFPRPGKAYGLCINGICRGNG